MAALLGAACLPALAARPMVTDDARVVDAKACQVESWQRMQREGAPSFWVVPACSPVEGLELSAGGARQSDDGRAHLADGLVQGKWLLRSLRPNDWGLALTLGRADDRLPALARHAHSHYLNLPLSYSVQDDALVLHLNLGWRHTLGAGRQATTWGLGSELQLRPGMQLIAETYGESGSRAFMHGGLRYWVVPERVQLDATYGTQARWGSSQRWVSIGLRLLSPPFLP